MKLVFPSIVSSFFLLVTGWAAPADLPLGPSDDAVMAQPAELDAMNAWAAGVFGNKPPADGGSGGLLPIALPFSFQYDGVSSADLLPGWTRTHRTVEAGGRVLHRTHWLDPKTGLRVTATATSFRKYPAVEWVLSFENTGQSDSPILENIQALDTRLMTDTKQPVVLHQIKGDDCTEQSFLPFETTLENGKPVQFAPFGGRSSNHTFPFFTLQHGDRGLITAIGWSGQWQSSLLRSDDGSVRLQAGMEKTHLRLHPGERIRSPKILLMGWKGDRLLAQNLFRRLLLFEYVPKQEGRPTALPAAMQCFDRYSRNRPDWATEAGQLRAIQSSHDIGFDTFWFDAGWFPGGFPDGVGNWFCKPVEFPRGLKPLSEASHERGMKFLLWLEPERASAGSQVVKEHPEFVFGGEKGGLFKLGDPAARAWMADLLSSRIKDFGVDCWRNDFNMDPLDTWRAADAPDRQGMTEIRYVEGHYALWDEMRARHPGLLIDNCSSGGRRIDLETLSRSVPLWRSDSSCVPGRADWDQNQTLGLSLYVPLFTTCTWEPKPYVVRSGASAGVVCQFDYLQEKFPVSAAKAVLAEAMEHRKFWYGDFYPLTPAQIGATTNAAWQLHRPDLNAGTITAFRRTQSKDATLTVKLHALAPDTRYTLMVTGEDLNTATRSATGSELMQGLEIKLPAPASSVVVRYTAEPRK